jgi:flagellar motor component MotA
MHGFTEDIDDGLPQELKDYIDDFAWEVWGKLTHEEKFVAAYFDFLDFALSNAVRARSEGLLALEDYIDSEEAANREIFHYGMRFAVDGVDPEIIDKMLSRIISQEKDPYKSLLKTIEKETVLEIQAGRNPRLLFALLHAYVDIPLSDPRVKAIFDDFPI